jgi:hypothetical protein
MSFEMSRLHGGDGQAAEHFLKDDAICEQEEHTPDQARHLRPLSPVRWAILGLCVVVILGPYYAFGAFGRWYAVVRTSALVR